MKTWEFITLLVSIVGSQLGSLYFLSARIDRVADKLDAINTTLGAHGEAISTLKGEKRLITASS